jgi:hypothetical protein
MALITPLKSGLAKLLKAKPGGYVYEIPEKSAAFASLKKAWTAGAELEKQWKSRNQAELKKAWMAGERSWIDSNHRIDETQTYPLPQGLEVAIKLIQFIEKTETNKYQSLSVAMKAAVRKAEGAPAATPAEEPGAMSMGGAESPAPRAPRVPLAAAGGGGGGGGAESPGALRGEEDAETPILPRVPNDTQQGERTAANAKLRDVISKLRQLSPADKRNVKGFAALTKIKAASQTKTPYNGRMMTQIDTNRMNDDINILALLQQEAKRSPAFKALYDAVRLNRKEVWIETDRNAGRGGGAAYRAVMKKHLVVPSHILDDFFAAFDTRVANI